MMQVLQNIRLVVHSNEQRRHVSGERVLRQLAREQQKRVQPLRPDGVGFVTEASLEPRKHNVIHQVGQASVVDRVGGGNNDVEKSFERQTCASSHRQLLIILHQEETVVQHGKPC